MIGFNFSFLTNLKLCKYTLPFFCIILRCYCIQLYCDTDNLIYISKRHENSERIRASRHEFASGFADMTGVSRDDDVAAVESGLEGFEPATELDTNPL